MYAAIHRYDHVSGSIDDLIPAGQHLASSLNRVPGLIAYVLLDAGDGALVAVSVFENEAGLTAATRLLGQWLAEQHTGWLPHQPQVTIGEVVVQKGM